ncbi:MAG TPA: RdgB/HAM1 family non-canonical purine NTP pyrophosphatase [Steroidobacteraceae bacterium]|jgi:XTP/dITP diphosphohydrolase|nr:RdgB/HAM1 family non-canonical purine NTP pyrophosphatase [Steroidobacteraceae bacterium]
MPRNSTAAPRRRLIVASANPGKLREFRALLAELPFAMTSLAELKLPSPEETGGSFLENALLKARHAAALSESAAVADDSGLEVDALGGAPGIYSARYAGSSADDEANNVKLINALRGVPRDRRQARYRCALVFAENAQDPKPLVAEADWEGFILDAPQGTGGFGYDRYFWLPDLNKTAAELAPAEKNRLSHRGKAMRALREQLQTRAKLELAQ